MTPKRINGWKLKICKPSIPTRITIQTIIVVIGVVMTLIPSLLAEERMSLIRIGTGGKTGVYYPIGNIIAHGLTGVKSSEGKIFQPENGIPGYIAVAQNSAGSIENVKKVTSGEIEVGLVQADVAAWASEGKYVFKGNKRVRGIRAIASLYPEKFQLVVRSDANISSVKDLVGKKISVDEIGSGTLAVMRIVLEAHGMTEKELRPVYLKPVFTHDKLINGELQGFVMMAGVPMAAVSQLSKIGITLVPISAKAASWIEKRYPFLVPGTISADIYEGVPEIYTIQVHALMVVNETMDEKLAFKITAALWSQRTLDMLRKGHPLGKSITLETAMLGISIPLHPGASKFYQEHNMRFRDTSQ
jgi:TRAP transporter TAXI family solute receptor